MRHVLRRSKGFIAVPAVLALTLAACDTDDDSPTVEQDTEDEQAVLPSGVFGDDCQDLLAGADTDATTGTGTDTDTETETDDGIGEDDGVDQDEGLEEDDGEELSLASTATDDTEDDGTETDTEADTETDTEDDGTETDTEDDGTETDTEAETETDTEADTTATVEEQDLRDMTLLEALEALPDFDTLVAELQGSQLESELEQESEVTLFAPTDDAFESLEGDDGTDTGGTEDGIDDTDTDEGMNDEPDTEGTDEGMDADDGATGTVTIDERLLAYHLHLDGALFAQDLVDQEDVTTAADDAGDLQVTADGDAVTVDGEESTAQVTCANIETQDGTIHVIDEVLVPGAEGDEATESDEDADAEADADPGTEDDADTDADTDADADEDADGDEDADEDTN